MRLKRINERAWSVVGLVAVVVVLIYQGVKTSKILKAWFNDSLNTSQIVKKELDICSWTDLSRKENTDLNRDCRKKLHKKKNDIFGERSFGRLLMFGDSTVQRLSDAPTMQSLWRNITIPNYNCESLSSSDVWGCDIIDVMKQPKAPV